VTKRYIVLLPMLAALGACGDDGGTGPTGAKPVLTAIQPAQGTVGTEVRVDGSSFSASGVRVFFNALESQRVELEGGAVHARAPEGLTAGAVYTVRVMNDGGQEDTLANAFTAVEPDVERVNGATSAIGLIGMTVIIEGAAFGDSPGASSVYFAAADGSPIQAVIADTINDWTDAFIVTSVPQGTADTSAIWVETPTGVSDSVEFRLIQSGTFSPSLINWTQAAPLPQPLQGLGALFVTVEAGATPANYTFAIGGADTLGTATTSVYRAMVEQTGVIGSWSAMAALPQARAYAATAAATVFTAALDTTTAAVLYVVGGKDEAGATVPSVLHAAVDLAGNIGAWQTGPARRRRGRIPRLSLLRRRGERGRQRAQRRLPSADPRGWHAGGMGVGAGIAERTIALRTRQLRSVYLCHRRRHGRSDTDTRDGQRYGDRRRGPLAHQSAHGRAEGMDCRLTAGQGAQQAQRSLCGRRALRDVRRLFRPGRLE
jgi:hypothetical protein